MTRNGTFAHWLGGQHARLLTRKCTDWQTCPCNPGATWHDGRLSWYGRLRFLGWRSLWH